MNYLKIEHSDVCNGVGLRCSIWLSGCSHRCTKCFNQESWNPNSGIPFDETVKQEIFDELSKDYISGITLTGGDPLYEQNLDDVLSLINEIHLSFPEKSIWLYSGYTWDYIMDGIARDENGIFCFTEEDRLRYEIVSNVDVFVDGTFKDELKDITLKWRGSSNQRVIDVKKSFDQNKIVLYCD